VGHKNVPQPQFFKSISIWQSYWQKVVGTFLWPTVYIWKLPWASKPLQLVSPSLYLSLPPFPFHRFFPGNFPLNPARTISAVSSFGGVSSAKLLQPSILGNFSAWKIHLEANLPSILGNFSAWKIHLEANLRESSYNSYFKLHTSSWHGLLSVLLRMGTSN